MESKALKIVNVADGAAGKTCLLIRFTQGYFWSEYSPTVFDNYAATIDIKIKGEPKTVKLDFWDTAGQEEYDRLRPLSYPGTDIFLLYFSVDNPNSFENLETKWLPEVRHHCPRVPLFVVGTKTDLRNDERVIADLKATGQSPVTYKMGVELAKRIGALKYVECSAVTGHNVQEVFFEIVEEYFKSRPEGNGGNEGTTAAMCCWKGGEPEVVRTSAG